MKELSLQDYMEQYGVTQGQLAEKLGKTQGAISHMVNNTERDIRVRVFGDGEIYVYQIRPVAKSA